MAQVDGILEAPDRLRVQVINYLLGDIPNENIPEYPVPERGIEYILYYNPIDKTFWFESQNRDYTIDEKTEEIFDNIIPIKTAVQLSIKPLILSDNLSIDDMLEIISIFPDYEIGVYYNQGDIFKFEEKLFEVIQQHTSQQDWNPSTTPQLYKNKTPDNVIADWIQPTGQHDQYNTGDIVSHNEQLWISTIDANVWEPGVYGWDIYTE